MKAMTSQFSNGRDDDGRPPKVLTGGPPMLPPDFDGDDASTNFDPKGIAKTTADKVLRTSFQVSMDGSRGGGSQHDAEEEEEEEGPPIEPITIGGGGGGGGDAHFDDVARVAARALENVDMDRLCSELFTEEMLEEVVGAAAGAQRQAQGGTGPAAAGAPPNFHSAAAAAPTKDCAASSGSELSEVTVPSTIAVPTPNEACVKVLPSITAVPSRQSITTVPSGHQLTKPVLNFNPQQQQRAPAATQALSGGAGRHGNPITASPPQFSQPRGDGGGHRQGPPPHQGQVPKKQRSDDGTALAAPGPVHRVQPSQSEELVCVKCNFPGADVRIQCPTGGCAYHARCLDLGAICRACGGGTGGPGERGEVRVRACPHCALPCSGMEILPLGFAEMDRVQQNARAAFLRSGLGGLVPPSSAAGSKRTHDDLASAAVVPLPTIVPSHSGTQPRRTVQCYDPAQPRTGRWTDEEVAFRDTLIAHFLAGALPLQNGLKLNDFLPAMLKSKQSRLAKKMKHAKLSTKYFHPRAGCVPSRPGAGGAAELSRLEREFVDSIPDPVERSEVRFHMSSQWREHLAARCASLGVRFDGRRWLGSVEDMERRLAFEKERHRLVKRRFLMGKAMEKDCDAEGRALERGVFVRTGSEDNGRDEFELVVEKSVSNSAGSGDRRGPSPPAPSGREREAGSGWSSNEPNFKHAAPFLAGIASYIERNGVPFEHVDVWVPSFVENPSATEGSGSPGNKGGGPRGDGEPNFRLCFGGSVTMGVQIVDGDPQSSSGDGPGGDSPPGPRRVPLPPETKSSLSLFGLYSEKFSFSSDCGLPGRIFHSGVPAWERFVSEAPASQFERRGGALQFGVKTAVGLPVDSPNVGRIVLVMYSKFDREKDEQLVGRMMCDLKLLCPSPRWKLVVDVDSPAVGVAGGGKRAGLAATVTGTASSLEAPPPVNTRSEFASSPRGSPVPHRPAQAGVSRNISAGSVADGAAPRMADADPLHQDPVAARKDRQIKDLLLLLAGNIPSSPSSPSPLAEHLQSIMSLRLVLLRGGARSPEEEALVETVLVLYESYLHAGRSRKDIAVMVARDFAFHLGHQKGGAGLAPPQPPHQPPPVCPPPTMYIAAQQQAQRDATVAAARAVQRGPAPHAPWMPSMGSSSPHVSVPGFKASGQLAPAPLVNGFKAGVPQQLPRMPLMNDPLGNSPLLNGFTMGSSPPMGPVGGFNHRVAPQASQQNLMKTPSLMGLNFNGGFPAAQSPQLPRNNSAPFSIQHNSSVGSFANSPRSAVSR